MRVLVDDLEGVIEGEVIDGTLLDIVSGFFDLDGIFTFRADDGVCFQIHGWMIEVEVLNESFGWVM